MPGYRERILGHGILAAITFLLIVPLAIILARFYHRNPRLALRLHIWLQIMTVLLSTAIFVLGFQAVGIRRSLTNPHHGIGVALYTLVLVQAIGGCIIHRVEKGKERFKVPLKLMVRQASILKAQYTNTSQLHQWMGRLVALLGIIQVALGLTLYGSPKVLFILYAVWAFILLVAYFILSYKNQPEMAFDDRSTYITERTASSRRSRSHRGHGMAALATAGAAGAGLAALRRRSRSRSRRGPSGGRQEVLSSHPSESYVSEEKYTQRKGKNHTWRDRLFGATAATGGILAVRSLFNRNKHPQTESGSDVSYSRPIGPSEVTQTDLSRLEEGRAPASPGRDHWRRVEEREAAQAAAMGASPLRKGHRPTRSGASIDSYDSRASFSDVPPAKNKNSHTLRDGIAALGVMGFLKHKWNSRKYRDEDERVAALKQQDIDEERLARANSSRRKFTGDGAPPRRTRPPSTIFSDSDISGVTPSMSRAQIPPPPKASTNLTNVEATAGPSSNPGPHGVLSDSGSEAYTSAGGGHHRRHRNAGPEALAAGAAGAAVAGAAAGSPSRRDRSGHRSSREDGINSPPVSVKVKMHNDGRHVTLRRLNEEEAAAEREARRKQRRGRNGSISSLSNFENQEHWRRTEAREAAQAAQASQASAPISMPEPVLPPPPPGPPPGVAPVGGQQIPLPPPPPIPAAAGSVLSSPQGTQVYGTETDVSNFDSNRRRRRAERAQAKAARAGGGRVEFS